MQLARRHGSFSGVTSRLSRDFNRITASTGTSRPRPVWRSLSTYRVRKWRPLPCLTASKEILSTRCTLAVLSVKVKVKVKTKHTAVDT